MFPGYLPHKELKILMLFKEKDLVKKSQTTSKDYKEIHVKSLGL